MLSNQIKSNQIKSNQIKFLLLSLAFAGNVNANNLSSTDGGLGIYDSATNITWTSFALGLLGLSFAARKKA